MRKKTEFRLVVAAAMVVVMTVLGCFGFSRVANAFTDEEMRVRIVKVSNLVGIRDVCAKTDTTDKLNKIFNNATFEKWIKEGIGAYTQGNKLSMYQDGQWIDVQCTDFDLTVLSTKLDGMLNNLQGAGQ